MQRRKRGGCFWRQPVTPALRAAHCQVSPARAWAPGRHPALLAGEDAQEGSACGPGSGGGSPATPTGSPLSQETRLSPPAGRPTHALRSFLALGNGFLRKHWLMQPGLGASPPSWVQGPVPGSQACACERGPAFWKVQETSRTRR